MLCATAAVESCWWVHYSAPGSPIDIKSIATAAITTNDTVPTAMLMDFANCWYILVAYQLVVHADAS